MIHGWHSESPDGPKGGWNCVLLRGCNDYIGRLTQPQLLDVVWCSTVVVAVVVVVVVVFAVDL